MVESDYYNEPSWQEDSIDLSVSRYLCVVFGCKYTSFFQSDKLLVDFISEDKV